LPKGTHEEVVFRIEQEQLRDIVQHPNQEKYSGQRIFIVSINDYTYLFESYENDEWISIDDMDIETERYQEYASATFKKDKRVNIRISSKDLEGIKKSTGRGHPLPNAHIKRSPQICIQSIG
jgi:predicted DNA binding CopG/RHH family protein